ncbi:hypothetical protein BRC63_01880 [Halobacteriales archaeon QH_10_70_21]|nr:MAG: hypothetical protein BRC63_01880 [Halobacteriales archaeon QH_10_70_21]
MSDDFDREAEREKLREKYERDKAKREASERMSELLLQGATMTNRHCPECHSPVFTYEGTAFCPTCQREVTEDGELAGEAGAGAESGDAGPTDDDGAATADAGPTDDAENGEAAAVSADGKTVGESHPESGTAPEADATGEPAGAAESSVDEERTGPRSAGRRQPPPARREERGGERRGLDDAEAALVREITNLTRRAEETRDVGRKRDFFAAAREAAETLETVRRL